MMWVVRFSPVLFQKQGSQKKRSVKRRKKGREAENKNSLLRSKCQRNRFADPS